MADLNPKDKALADAMMVAIHAFNHATSAEMTVVALSTIIGAVLADSTWPETPETGMVDSLTGECSRLIAESIRYRRAVLASLNVVTDAAGHA